MKGGAFQKRTLTQGIKKSRGWGVILFFRSSAAQIIVYITARFHRLTSGGSGWRGVGRRESVKGWGAGQGDGVSVRPRRRRGEPPKKSHGFLQFDTIHLPAAFAVGATLATLSRGGFRMESNQVPVQAGELLAADADALSLLWTVDLRDLAGEVAQSMFDAETLRADAGKADLQAYSAVTALLASQSPTEVDGRTLEFHERVQMVGYGWYMAVRGVILDAYRAKRPGLKDNSYDQAWKRITDLVAHVLKDGFKVPTSTIPDSVRKAEERAAAKAKREQAQQELLAAFEGKSQADLQASLKAAYTRAGKGDAAADQDIERIKSVLKVRSDTAAAEATEAVSERWKAILVYSKRKVDGADNTLFVSDIRVLDAVLDVLQSQ